jgi:hypothetical protein
LFVGRAVPIENKPSVWHLYDYHNTTLRHKN